MSSGEGSKLFETKIHRQHVEFLARYFIKNELGGASCRLYVFALGLDIYVHGIAGMYIYIYIYIPYGICFLHVYIYMNMCIYTGPGGNCCRVVKKSSAKYIQSSMEWATFEPYPFR